MNTNIRNTLLGSAFGLVAGLASVALATPAAAQSCTITPVANPTQNVVCAAGATNNSTNLGTSPAADREYNVTTVSGNSTTTVNGALTGNGLAITHAGGTGNSINFVNNGSVTVDAAASPTVGGTGAIDISALNGTNISYSGNGAVSNLSGNLAPAIALDSSGTGNVTAVVGGNIVSSGDGLRATSSGSGNINLTTNGTSIRARYAGVDGDITNALSAGTVTINNSSAIGSQVGAPGTLVNGVYGNTSGTGAVSVTNSGAIGSSTDVVTAIGVVGQIFNSASTSNVDVSNSGNVYSGDASLYAYNGGSGAITLGNTGALTSTTTGPGIYVQQAGTGTTGLVTITNSGTINGATNGIQSSNAGTGGITVTNNGAITTAGMGIRARGLSATETGAITVQGNGTVNAAGTGILATSAGTSPVTVNYTGAVTSTGGTGVSTSATSGATTITTNAVSGAITGIQAVSTGTQSITTNGNVNGTSTAGIHSDTTANRTITVNSGTVTGGAEAILLTSTGAATINNSGTIGAAASGLAVQAPTAGAVTLNNNTGATLNGRLALGAGNDLVSNSGTFNTQGTTDFGTGTDVLTNSAGGTINLTGNTVFTGLDTFNQNGALKLNTFTLTGSGTLNNTGTITTTGNGSLLGFTAYNNSGTTNLAAGTLTVSPGIYTNSGTINAVNGASTITGQTSFVNTGLINLQDGAANDTLTINSAFSGGAGSTLNIDAGNTASDRLVINGAASGSTTVNANILGPTGALIGGGLLAVDTTSSTANAFTLGSVTGAANPLLNYTLDQVGADYYLNAAVTPQGFVPVQAATLAPSMWYQSADVIIANNQLPDDGTTTGGPWAQLYYGRDKMGEDVSYSLGGNSYDVNNHVKATRHGMQFGYDAVFGGAKVGATAGYEVADGEFDAGSATAKGWNFGVYGGFGVGRGIHGTALVKWDRYKVNPSGLFDTSKGRAFGVDGELGYRFGGPGAINYDLTAGLSHVSSKLDGFTVGTLDYDIGKVKSTRGRIGGRIDFGGQWGWFFDAKAYHEFEGDRDVTLTDGITDYDLGMRGKATWLKGEIGFGGPAAGAAPSMSFYATAGDVKSVGVRAGFRF